MITALATIVLSAAPAFELEWEAPASCPNRPDTISLVGDATGRAEVQLKEREGQWVVTIMFFAPMEGTRRVTVPTCEDAVRTAGLLVQLGSRGGFQQKPPSPVIAETKPAVTEPPSPPEKRWQFSTGLGGALDLGTLPLAEPPLAASFLANRQLLGFAADLRVGLAQPVSDVRALHLIELQGAGCLLSSLGPGRVGPAPPPPWGRGGSRRSPERRRAWPSRRRGCRCAPASRSLTDWRRCSLRVYERTS